MTEIKFIYFDVGGVVIKDFSATSNWLAMQSDLGIKPEQTAEFRRLWDESRDQVCIDLEADELMRSILKSLGVGIKPDYSALNDFINRFELNKTIWPIIEQAKQKYQVGLLTNMYPGMLEAIRKAKLLPPVTWDAIVDSSVVKAQKPEKKMFEIAQARANVSGEHILFVDNSQEHVEAAQQIGWRAYLYDSTNYEESSKQLARYLDF